jgi:hypothetical protein
MLVLRRIWRVLRAEEDVFFEIGLDRNAGKTAFGVILLVGLLSGVGWVVKSERPWILLASLLTASLVVWYVFAGTISFFDQLIWAGGMSRIELLRMAGFTMAPLVWLSIPYIGWLSMPWFLVLSYKAIHSLYSTKPAQTLGLIGAAGLVSCVAWGFTVLMVSTVLESLVS